MNINDKPCMKIGYLMQTGVPDIRKDPPSGPANHVNQVINHLKELGHDVLTIVCLEGRIYRSEDLLRFSPISITWLDGGPIRWFERFIRRIQYELKIPYAAFFESIRFAFACRRELKDVHVLYERMGWFGYGGALAAKWIKVPWVLEVNGDHLSEFEMLGVPHNKTQRWLAVRLIATAIRRVTHVVATGEGWRHLFIQRWGIKPELVSVIENGSELVERIPRDSIRAFHDTSKNNPLIEVVYVGGFEPWHGIHILIEAVKRAMDEGLKLRLVLIGSGTQREHIEKQVLSLDMNEAVTFTGYLPMNELSDVLSTADIGVSPYCGREEYSGLKLLDYKAAGLPTIASGSNGEPKVIQHGQTGWIIPPGDTKALRDAIVHLSNDHSLRKKMGRQARKEAEQHHTWRHTCENIEAILERAIIA